MDLRRVMHLATVAVATLLLTACASGQATPPAAPAASPIQAASARPTTPPSATSPSAAPAASPSAVAQPAASPVAAPAVSPSPSVSTVVASSGQHATGEVTVFAASSLTDAFKEIGTAFEGANPGTKVTLNFGASSQLRTQLDQGARADVFASADQAQMDAARKGGSVSGADHIFARNRLTIITPKDNPRGIQGPCDLAKPGIKFVTSQPSVPVGQYTVAMLDKGTGDVCGTDFRAGVENNTVSQEDNVRQIVAKVQLGEGDAGVVYSSDVTPQVRDQLEQVAIPDELNTLASYPIATTNGANPSGGQAFATYVLSPAAQDILATWGFIKAGG